MRKIIAFNRVSADGFFAAPDGNLNWATPDDELEHDATRDMAGTGTMLFGRVTYQAFESFWPNALRAGGDAGDPHAAGRTSPALTAMANWINEAHKLVFSRTLKEPSWHNAHVLGAFDPARVAALKQEPGKDIMIFGSGSIASLLTQHGLIDEYTFVVCPVLLGAGRTLLREVPNPRRLELIASKSTRAGNVALRYRPAR
jgi:dihydrofolate reductase